MGQYLLVGDYWIECASDGFSIHNIRDDGGVEVLEIRQNESGIDKEKRVEKAVDWYRKRKTQ